MRETIIRTNNSRPDSSTFGGIIYYSDFNTDYNRITSRNGSSMADRILRDFAFDLQCKKNIENRNIKISNSQPEYEAEHMEEKKYAE